MPKSKKINLDNHKSWSEFDWSDPVVPEVLKRTDRVVATARNNRIKAQDPEFRAKLKTSSNLALKNPEVQQARSKAARKGGDTKANSVEYQQLMTEVNRKKAEKLEFADNVRKGINNKRLADPTAMRKGGSTQVKACTNNKGETFTSRVLAAKAYNVDPRVMGKWIKKGKDGWRYL
jgi:hypothetical protein